MPAVTDGGQKVPMTSIRDRWLKATISTLWVGNSELNDTAAFPAKAPICSPPVIPIDGTPSKSDPISSETFFSAMPLAPNGSFQVPFMVAKNEMPFGTTRTPPMNSSGLASMVTSTAPATEIEMFSGSGTNSNSASLRTTPSVIAMSPIPAASDSSLSLVPTCALTSRWLLPEELVGAEAGQVQPAVDEQSVFDPGTGDGLQSSKRERGVVERGDDDQRVRQMHAVQAAQRR